MTDQATAVSVRGLGKRYRIDHEERGRYKARYGRLTESAWSAITALVRGRRRTKREWLWVLKDVSFDVDHGEVLGIVGRNGAGKSTLLKILARITEPTAGEATLRGRAGSLLEVGTGFHPELTGRENIFLSGALLGMRGTETRRLFDEIVDFSGVETFIDTPVKRYSSGMQVRLAFAVAAHLSAEILIIDEVLAVGDAAFQRKCLAKMEDISHEGRTILFVSHNMPAVEALCTRAMLLDGGRLIASGPTSEIVADYLRTVETAASSDLAKRTDRRGRGQLRLTRVDANVRTGAPSTVTIHYEARQPLRNVAVSVALSTSRGEPAGILASDISGTEIPQLPARGAFVCRLERATILPGRYTATIFCSVNGQIADWVTNAAVIDVTDGDFFGTGRLPADRYGPIALTQAWSVEPT